MEDDVETWKSTRPGMIYVMTFDPMTKRKQSVAVRPGGTLTLTTRERVLNQEITVDEANDLFTNGALIPVNLPARLLDSPDAAEIASNPNHLTDDDMREVLKLKAPALKKRLAEISNHYVVQRLLDLANVEDEDSPLSLAQIRAIEARAAELNTDPVVEERESI